MALVGDPELLFLDEPTTGFDPSARRQFWDVIESLKELGKTIFLTTHYMDEAEHCDRIAIMNEGRIVALDTPDALKAQIGADRVTVTTDDDEAALRAHVRDLAARFKVPAHVVFRRAEDIPRTTSGKVAKQELKAEWARGITR